MRGDEMNSVCGVDTHCSVCASSSFIKDKSLSEVKSLKLGLGLNEILF